MSYTSKQTAPESQRLESGANKVVSPKFADQRASTSVQLKQQEMMGAVQRAEMEEEEPLQGKFATVQRAEDEELLQGKFETAQLAGIEEEAPIQGKLKPLQCVSAEEEQSLQGKFNSTKIVQREIKPNNTGLPDNLKSGIENLSGYSMDDVKVHYNSDKPAALNAHAYAQGTDIHVAPGQEQHLPHEAWHVVQQKQGRVQATKQMKAGVPVNDDAGLENEADVMGAKAMSMENLSPAVALTNAAITQNTAQRVGGSKVGYDPGAIVKPEFKLAAKNLFSVARDVNKIRKKIATKKNNNQLRVLEENLKGPQVKGAYALELSDINMDTQWLHTVVADKPKVNGILNVAKDEAILDEGDIPGIKDKIRDSDEKIDVKPEEEKIYDKTWVEKVGETRPEAKILIGKALFVRKTVKDESTGVYRDIYKKLGKEDSDHNEYILDDLDNYTRRYAYMEKSYYQWMAFKEKGFLTGKKQELVAAATGVSAKDVDPTEFESQGMKKDEQDIFNDMPADTPENRKIALAHMHQWKGSGPGQRGLSLTSTDKDEAVYGNSGESFKTADGAKFKIDLAKTKPVGNILINHYANGSKTRENLQGSAVGSNRKLGAKYQYERSVIKNRELYLRNLTPDAVVSITPHTPTMDIDRDSAIFNDNKKNAIQHGEAQKNVAAWTEHKKGLQAKFDKATRDKSSAALLKADALKEKKNANTKKNQSDGDRRRYRFKGYTYDVTYFIYWRDCETKYAKQENIQIANIEKLDQVIADLTPQLKECDDQIEIWTKDFMVKPDESELHASRGWATGEAYNKGYNEGLIAIGGKTLTKESSVKKIFDEAYGDASKKANDKNYKEKHAPYWEGFGAALKTAIKT